MDEVGSQRFDTRRESLERDSEIDYVKASGPGGQHKNKRETGVRLVHEPSGVVVTATERRSRAQNLEAAYERLAARLDAMNFRPKPRRIRRVSKQAKLRRLDAKRRRSSVKALRRPPTGE